MRISPRTLDVLNIHKALSIILYVAASGIVAQPVGAQQTNTQEQSNAVFIISTSESAGTGFACTYKGREFVATNLHVIDGTAPISVKSQASGSLKLSGQMIAANDADICLLAIDGKFSDKGIKPLEFAANAFIEAKVGDAVQCWGNTLGNGVITATGGKILGFGTPRLEIDCPLVGGNSGGPVIHQKTGKVVGIVTEAEINKLTFDALGVAATKAKGSQVRPISYFAHRIDTVEKWEATTVANYLEVSATLKTAHTGLSKATLFLADKKGWEEDPRLTAAWNDYQRFIEAAKDKTSSSVKVSETVVITSFAVVVRRDVKVRRRGVAQADYDKAYEAMKRAVEWKILADQENLKKAKPVGLRQLEARNEGLEFCPKVLLLHKEL